MPEYKLTLDAEVDLLDIAIYTIDTWGLDQTDRYEAAIAGCFAEIARGEARFTTPIPHRPELRATRCEHHFVFSLHQPSSPPLILAILHEHMDLMERVRERME